MLSTVLAAWAALAKQKSNTMANFTSGGPSAGKKGLLFEKKAKTFAHLAYALGQRKR
jgi:hypothetical protein